MVGSLKEEGQALLGYSGWVLFVGEELGVGDRDETRSTSARMFACSSARLQSFAGTLDPSTLAVHAGTNTVPVRFTTHDPTVCAFCIDAPGTTLHVTAIGDTQKFICIN